MDMIRLTDGCLGDETMKVRCDLAQAAAPVEVCYSGDTWEPTQYQCADARHTRRGLEQIARLLAAAACEATAEEAEACEITDEPPVFIEFAVANETIRDGGGIDEFAGLEHPYMADACAAIPSASPSAPARQPQPMSSSTPAAPNRQIATSGSARCPTASRTPRAARAS